MEGVLDPRICEQAFYVLARPSSQEISPRAALEQVGLGQAELVLRLSPLDR
jgi:hypothetical protein